MQFLLEMNGWAMGFRFGTQTERERVRGEIARVEGSLRADDKSSAFEFGGPDQTFDLILVGRGSLGVSGRRNEIVSLCQHGAPLDLDSQLVRELAARHWGYCSDEVLSTVGCRPENQPAPA